VALDALPDPDLRKRMGWLLSTLDLRTEITGLSSATTFFLPRELERQTNPLLLRVLAAIELLIGPAPGMPYLHKRTVWVCPVW
jgi:hypothetical protein